MNEPRSPTGAPGETGEPPPGRWTGALVVALAVAARVVWVLLVPTKPVGDFAMYLEAAVHLEAHGALDPEFVYMPGYVLLAAGVLALGGGLTAVKLAGAALAGAAAGAAYGLGVRLGGRRAGLVAGLGYALWPAGIAVASVTGTDMPAAALLLLAVWALVRLDARPWLAVVAFGALMGLGAYVRAVAVQLAGFAVFYRLAVGDRWWRALARAGLAGVVALLVLAPWAVRNHARYGAWFITDSHGGLTALVGANPNTDGRYSRSLNRVFKEATGYTLLAEPHRDADRAAYALAKQWTAFSPAFAAGLVAAKADRLLAHQRALLYWPLYRDGVLRGGARRLFAEHRAALERLCDAWWLLLVVTFTVGVAVSVARRRWPALAFLPVQIALAGIYALYFAEVRYQLPIVALAFPLAGIAVSWAAGVVAEVRRARALPPPLRAQLVWAAAGVLVVLVGWQALQLAGARLRDRHRFAAHVCALPAEAEEAAAAGAGAGVKKGVCLWRPVGSGDSPVRGLWDGVGLRLGGARAAPAAELPLTLAPGRYRVRARVDLAPAPAAALAGEARLAAGGVTLASWPLDQLAALSRQGEAASVDAVLDHPGGESALRLSVAPAGPAPATALWLVDLSLGAATGWRSSPR